ncbi:NAD-dependent epimerase/dehydratase family protein [Staphylococcus gallinarum]|uniref:NmrA family NAD(P)-binding protein n=1 Tax=Staphylococcus gallinarum TaxID=1293 RepID=UPI000E685C01|nr:NmrA family NAD(P)-binding protein [Staphylococcus gallinarum]MCD8872237.1 NmrA family NAD(P)-binding protein [Staphylococcus gallinarum]MCW0984469.1 NmrA family NAD(P)-binding protein [Staphylococcus gallinarum]RIO83544.1 NAD-dependent epimerase/dehydratase family protein [Staphylococcus gallinarum]
MNERILVIGASGRVGSKVVKYLDENNEGIIIRLATSRPETAETWINEGREAVVLDLNNSETFPKALENVNRVFLLTGYTSDMLHQSKRLVDAAVDAGVDHIVHLGVFTSRRDMIPHFNWHDLVETYIESSGINWTHIHPNVIADTTLIIDPPITETKSFTVNWGNASQGWVFAEDIGAVSAKVLKEGPDKHGGANYWLSTEVLTSLEVADILSEVSGQNIEVNMGSPETVEAYISQIESPSVRAYMESAVITMKLGLENKIWNQNIIHDDVKTVVGRPGITMKEWAKDYFK